MQNHHDGSPDNYPEVLKVYSLLLSLYLLLRWKILINQENNQQINEL